MISRARALTAAVALWLLVVAGGSTVAWLVIDRAGRGVFSPTVAAGVPSATPRTHDPSSAASTTPPRTSAPSVTATRPSPTATTSPVRDSVTVTGGAVGVSCQGSALTLLYATPRDGWSMELEREPGQLSVTFRQQQGGGESEVQATCRAGRPLFETSASAADS